MQDNAFQGSLFSSDFLQESIARLPDWSALSDQDLNALARDLRQIFDDFPITKTPNESQTEDDLIWPILQRLGWGSSLRQQNLAARGRDDVPDGLLFKDDETKAQANRFAEEWKRYELGLAVVESKRWQRPLDRRSGKRGEETAPSSQMLRYLRRVDDLTTGTLRWGILTNGAKWRLYYSGARSVSEQFFEVDLAAILDVPGHNEGLFALSSEDRAHLLRVFVLIFRKEAFLPTASDDRTFHQRALQEGKFYEERVAASLSDVVFGRVFPDLARAIAAASPEAPLQQVREATLILLYRLLFILYAEDRDLLPVRDRRYDDYGLRIKVRGDVEKRKNENDTFSETAARYWSVLDDLCRALDQGDPSIGLPPYNGGLFDRTHTPLLADIRLGDAVMANVIDALSFEHTPDGRKYINYRNMSVQQLGSIYERLLEHEIIPDERQGIIVQPNIFARKGSGSYYTPEDLVGLIIRETVGPLVSARMDTFTAKARELETVNQPEDRRIGTLKRLDPAEKLLELKICDPAMGSGHFLVSLVDYLSDQVIAAMAEAEVAVEWGEYVSPLSDRIETIRNTILHNAEERNWTIDPEQLDDRHIIRRMVLKRCVYGVDKNPMAVELAKVALWLHTFTVGAPLSFLDHHLRCGDSLFGNWVKKGIDSAVSYGGALLLQSPIRRAMGSAASMQTIEGLTDAEIAEAHRSADIFAGVQDMTAELDAFLSLLHAFDWLNIKGKDDKAVLRAFFDGQFGDPVALALGRQQLTNGRAEAVRFAELYRQARELVEEERFFNWQVMFPGVWQDWQEEGLSGGFDAVIGNPPWDRMKLQQVEWFAARRPEIALAQRAAERALMVSALEEAADPLFQDYKKAESRAEAAINTARNCEDYPLLSGGDINLYSLFVERALTLVKENGMVGLLTPIGIATDKTSSQFFSKLATEGQVKAFLAFENRRGWLFADIHHEEQPSILIFSSSQNQFSEILFCVRVSSWDQFNDPERKFTISSASLQQVNPNTGTVPMFRTRRDAMITSGLYSRSPVLVKHTDDGEAKAWPVKYSTMFHMTNDSGLFRTRQALDEEEGAYPVGSNRWRSSSGDWVALYEGKMIQLFNHRYASVRINPRNISGQGVTEELDAESLANPDTLPEPRFWIKESDLPAPSQSWRIGFNDICNTNNARSLIAAAVPYYGFGNTLPTFHSETDNCRLELLLANLCSIISDYIARQKIQSRHLNKYIIEQIPVVPPDRYQQVRFGTKTAGDIVREAVLELTYTAHDMAPFAKDMGYVDDAGEVRPPFVWDEERRLRLRAKLDAVYFHLYGVTDRDDVRYIYSTFPIVEREETAAHGRYLSRDFCLAYMSALAAGDPDTDVRL
jgi:hypothetical protein